MPPPNVLTVISCLKFLLCFLYMESMTEKDFLFPDVKEADALQIMRPNVYQGCFHQKYDKSRALYPAFFASCVNSSSFFKRAFESGAAANEYHKFLFISCNHVITLSLAVSYVPRRICMPSRTSDCGHNERIRR